MAKTFNPGDEISFKVIAAGGREIELDAEIHNVDDIQNGTVQAIIDGTQIRDVRTSSIIGYDRPREEIGIIFAADMVRSLRARRKTVTRRLAGSPLRKRYAGDLLYVRESFRVAAAFNHVKPRELSPIIERQYLADGLEGNFGRSIPGIHMPRKFSRLTLEVLNIRKERLQDITPEDAIEEGIFPLIRAKSQIAAAMGKPVSGDECEVRYMNYLDKDGKGFEDPVKSFESLWSSLHPEPGFKWEDNPFVIRIEFDVHPLNVDAYLESLEYV